MPKPVGLVNIALHLFRTIRLRLFKVDIQKAHIIVPVLFAFLFLLATTPFTNVIYGLDSYNYFFNPFNSNFSPLFLYSYKKAWLNIVTDSSASFYISSFAFALRSFLSPPFVERVLLFVYVFIGGAGMFDLLTTLEKINHKENTVGNLIRKSLAIAFFIANPFTLSITLWHFEGWSLFMVLSPFWIALGLKFIYFTKFPFKAFLMTTIISILLAPGLSGPYAVSALYISMFTLLYLVIYKVRHKVQFKYIILGVIGILLLDTLTVAWINVPSFLVNFIFTSNSGYTSSKLLSIFYSNSAYASLTHVMGLSALGWLYTFPKAYGWSHVYNEILIISGYFLIPIFILGIFYVKRIKGLTFFYLLSIPVLIISVGSNFPFAQINVFLFNLKGPFLILTNTYYFIGQIYVISIIVVIYVIISNLFSSKRVPKVRENSGLKLQKIHFIINNNFVSKLKDRTSRKKVSSLIIILFLILVSIFWYPIISNHEYQTHYSQIDEFSMPSSFNLLESYFKENYSGPNYFVLILPMSAGSSYEFDFNGSSFVDSTSLFSSLIPYPVIETNQSFIAWQLDNFIASGNYTNLVPVLQVLHIKYVVFNPFFPSGSPIMTHGPNGRFINLTRVYNDIVLHSGRPTSLGNMTILKIPNVVPIAVATDHINYIYSSNLFDYLTLLSNVKGGNLTLLKSLKQLIWTNNTEVSNNSGTSVSLDTYNGITFKKNITGDNFVNVIYQNGTLANISKDVTYKMGSTIRELNLTSKVLFSLKNDTLLPTNFKNINDTYQSLPNTTNYAFTPTILGPATGSSYVFEINYSTGNNLKTGEGHWGLDLNSGNYTLKVAFSENYSRNTISFQESASYQKIIYAGYSNTVNLPATLNNSHLIIKVDNQSISFTLTTSKSGNHIFYSPVLYYPRNLLWHNTKSTSSIILNNLTNNFSLSKFQPEIWSESDNISIHNLNILEHKPYGFVLTGNVSNLSNSLKYNVTFSYQGNINYFFTKSDVNSSQTTYILLGYPTSSLWAKLGGPYTSVKLNSSVNYNIFLLTNAQSSTSHVWFGMTKSIHLVNDGLFISFGELIFITVLLVVSMTSDSTLLNKLSKLPFRRKRP